MRQFDTSIKKLMKEKNSYNLSHNREAIFLSSWDVVADTKPYSIFFRNNNSIIDEININDYYYWTDEHGYALFFEDYYKKTV